MGGNRSLRSLRGRSLMVRSLDKMEDMHRRNSPFELKPNRLRAFGERDRNGRHLVMKECRTAYMWSVIHFNFFSRITFPILSEEQKKEVQSLFLFFLFFLVFCFVFLVFCFVFSGFLFWFYSICICSVLFFLFFLFFCW
jgi:hypothetical protein